MKKIVFATVLAFSTIASAQWSMDLPNLWWPEEFTSDEVSADVKAEAKMIMESKNVKAYLKQNGLGKITKITKVGKKFIVTTLIDGCEFKAVIREGKVLPVKDTLVCGA